MITRDDVILALSWSGETSELAASSSIARPLPHSADRHDRRRRTARSAARPTPCWSLPGADEACPHGLAPTTSTLMQLALGDALAIALLESRGFTAEEFHVFHPGGQLGASLHFVRDIMHGGDALPLVAPDTPMAEALAHHDRQGLRLRRRRRRVRACWSASSPTATSAAISAPTCSTRTVGDVMTRTPKTVPPDCLVGEALAMMNQAHPPVHGPVRGRGRQAGRHRAHARFPEARRRLAGC